MARKKKETDPGSFAGFASVVVEKISEQITLLAGKNWPEIQKILSKEEEVKLSFGVTITDRAATPGEQADKDNRLKTTLAFSEKFSDSTEADLPDPNQPDLPIE